MMYFKVCILCLVQLVIQKIYRWIQLMLQYNIGELFMENSMEEWKSKASLLMITIAVMLANISMGSTILPNIVPGIGMISVVIPITTIIYSYVSKPETTNASSLQNIVKNVGCAVGTSSAGFLVSGYSQVHQSYLVDRLNELNSVF